MHVVQIQTRVPARRRPALTPTEVTIKSSLDEVKLSKVPEKIVTFDLGAADTIRALGFEKNIVGMPTKTVPAYLKDLAEMSTMWVPWLSQT